MSAFPCWRLRSVPRFEVLRERAKDFPDLDPTAVRTGLELLRFSSELLAASENRFETNGMSSGRFMVLIQLHKHALAKPEDRVPVEGLSPADLADAIGVTRATMTGLLDTLEKSGLVRREAHPADRRALVVRLTPAGKAQIEAYLPGHYRAMSALFADLSEGERRTLRKLVRRVRKALSALDEASP